MEHGGLYWPSWGSLPLLSLSATSVRSVSSFGKQPFFSFCVYYISALSSLYLFVASSSRNSHNSFSSPFGMSLKPSSCSLRKPTRCASLLPSSY